MELHQPKLLLLTMAFPTHTNQRQYKIWQQTLSYLFLCNRRQSKFKQDLQTNHTFGKWFPLSKQFQATHPVLYSNTTQQLFCKHSTKYKIRNSQSTKSPPSQRCFYKSFSIKEVSELPEDIIPVAYIKTLSFLLVTTPIILRQTQKKRNNPLSPIESIQTIATPWESDLVENIEFIDTHTLLQALQMNQEITLATDRGANQPSGSFGFVIAIKHRILVKGEGITPEHKAQLIPIGSICNICQPSYNTPDHSTIQHHSKIQNNNPLQQ